MKVSTIIKVSIIFFLGFLSANIVNLYFVYGSELPLPMGNNFLGFSTNPNQAPFDFVNEDQIQVLNDKVIINVAGASMSRYAPTGSMEPILDENSNGIRIRPKSEKDIHPTGVCQKKRFCRCDYFGTIS